MMKKTFKINKVQKFNKNGKNFTHKKINVKKNFTNVKRTQYQQKSFTNPKTLNLNLNGGQRKMLIKTYKQSTENIKFAEESPKFFGTYGKYAHALFDSAKDGNVLPAVQKDVLTFQSLCTNEDFSEYLGDPRLSEEEKQKGLNKELAAQGFNRLSCDFFDQVTLDGRIARIGKSLDHFNELAAYERGEIKAIVTSSEPLQNKHVAGLQKTLGQFVSAGQKVIIDNKIDKKILGGFIVDVGDYNVDFSVATKLQEVQRNLNASAAGTEDATDYSDDWDGVKQLL